MSRLFRLSSLAKPDPAVERWFRQHTGELGAIARHWFEVMRRCGEDVRECLHDGHPTACVDDAAFGYVNVFRAHINVGFFNGSAIDDPQGILVGSGKFMRHVKVVPGGPCDSEALSRLITAAYSDMKNCVRQNREASRLRAIAVRTDLRFGGEK